MKHRVYHIQLSGGTPAVMAALSEMGYIGRACERLNEARSITKAVSVLFPQVAATIVSQPGTPQQRTRTLGATAHMRARGCVGTRVGTLSR
jgi:hypothetical protein